MILTHLWSQIPEDTPSCETVTTTLCDSSHKTMWLLLLPYVTPLSTLYDSSHYIMWLLSLHYMISFTTLCDSCHNSMSCRNKQACQPLHYVTPLTTECHPDIAGPLQKVTLFMANVKYYNFLGMVNLVVAVHHSGIPDLRWIFLQLRQQYIW